MDAGAADDDAVGHAEVVFTRSEFISICRKPGVRIAFFKLQESAWKIKQYKNEAPRKCGASALVT